MRGPRGTKPVVRSHGASTSAAGALGAAGSLEERFAANFNRMAEANRQNMQAIANAFAMNDVHLQVTRHLIHVLGNAVIASGVIPADLKMLPTTGLEDPRIDLDGYYRELAELREKAGERADVACTYWSQGHSPELALEMAERAPTQSDTIPSPPPAKKDEEYDVEYFGGQSAQNIPEQVAQTAHAGG